MKTHSLISSFEGLNDPRINRTKLHPLENIIFITVSAVICGFEGWDEIAEFGVLRRQWLERYLDLSNGIPSHDTFNRVFTLIEPSDFEKCFQKWIKDLFPEHKDDIINLDGKSLRGTKNHGAKSLTHIVSAWSNAKQAVIAQLKTDSKSNEITILPELIKSLDLEGAIITIDAMGCQKEIAKTVQEKGADYVLSVKGNQSKLLEDVEYSFKNLESDFQITKEDFGHGRIEERKYELIKDLDFIDTRNQWTNIKSIVKLSSFRYLKATAEQQSQVSYFISSEESLERISKSIRSHWSIENQLHWQLDVSFSEDKDRKRKGNAAENYSRINRMVLNMIKKNKNGKSVKLNRLKAAVDSIHLEKILGI